MVRIFQLAQFWTVILFTFISIALCVNLYWIKNISPLMYLIYGFVMIGLALVLVLILGSMNAAAKFKLSAQEYELFSIQFQTALYIFPFISAAIGTNLISQAIVENKKHKKANEDKKA
ncbi:MAG: hypothetical protein QOH63_3508 [Acidobacteriota bacterium]|jgi:hypothetical protein|nr:hypothetical protein [Acidobacteriota bacterium]